MMLISCVYGTGIKNLFYFNEIHSFISIEVRINVGMGCGGGSILLLFFFLGSERKMRV